MHSSGLQKSYLVIGQALVQYAYKVRGSNSASHIAFTELREDLVFVTVEVLESYLEDLLNIKVSDETLFIAPEKCAIKSIRCEVWVVAIALLAGCICLLFGAGIAASILGAVVSSLPLILFFNLAPLTVKRRMLFAQALSKEISRRRGRDDDTGLTKIAIRDFFIKHDSQPGLPGAARYRLH